MTEDFDKIYNNLLVNFLWSSKYPTAIKSIALEVDCN